MSFVQYSQLRLAFGDRDLLDGVGINLKSGSRAALAGPNGAGKSTLMKIVAGQLQPDSGDRAVERGTRISYLPQSGITHAGRSLRAELETAFGALQAMVVELEELGQSLSLCQAGAAQLDELLLRHHELGEAIQNAGYYRREEGIQRVAAGLGFKPKDLDRDCAEFSGGWQMRVALAKILLEGADILLLDEPTNYLDIEARQWLVSFLNDYQGGYLLVSHDRSFLDSTVNEVYELFNGRLNRYPGDYSSYESRRAKELESLFESWEKQQEEIQALEDFIRRFRYNASKATLVQSRVKALERIVPIQIPEGMKRIHFRFPDPPHSGRIALSLTGLGRSYGDIRVFSGLDLELEAGEKLALVGRNGAGKSTLSRILAGVDPGYLGSYRLGAGISVGYFAQDTPETLNGEGSVESELESVAPTQLIPKLRNLLGAFLFRGDDVQKSVSVLSGGERSRLAILKLLLHPSNLLIMDEPTNHLDLTSKDVLLEALQGFPGTVVFVSHDRFFLEGLATKVLEIEGGRATLYPGGYAYYVGKKASDALGAHGDPGLQRDSPNSGPASKPAAASGAAESLNREQEKQKKAQERKKARREEELMALVDGLEAQKRAQDEALTQPENYANGERVRAIKQEIVRLEAAIAAATAEWEALA